VRGFVDQRKWQIEPHCRTIKHEIFFLPIMSAQRRVGCVRNAAKQLCDQCECTLWYRCRAYKIVGAQGTLDTVGDDSLWRYQRELIAAARSRDAAAAAAVNEQSLVNATDRIRALLVAQSDAS
jgi:hypothetical protein